MRSSLAQTKKKNLMQRLTNPEQEMTKTLQLGKKEKVGLQKFQCAVCKAVTANLCPLCEQVFYCSQKHQQAHWPQHQDHCHGFEAYRRQQEEEDRQKRALMDNKQITKEEELSDMIKDFQEEDSVQGNSWEERSTRRKAVYQDIQLRRLSMEETGALLRQLVELGREAELQGVHQRLEVFCDWMVLLKWLRREDRPEQLVKESMACAAWLEKHSHEIGLVKTVQCQLGLAKQVLRAGNLTETEKRIQASLEQLKLNKEGSQCLQGQEHLITIGGDLYFLLGVFYFEKSYLDKAEHCFTISQNLRETGQGEDKESQQFIPDNLFNIAYIKMKQGNRREAWKHLSLAKKKLHSHVGDASLNYAYCLELEARIRIENNTIVEATAPLKRTLSIFQKIYTNQQHPDILRAMRLQVFLQKYLREKNQEKKTANRPLNIWPQKERADRQLGQFAAPEQLYRQFSQHLGQTALLSHPKGVSVFSPVEPREESEKQKEESVQSPSMKGSANNVHALKLFSDVEIKLPRNMLEQLSTDHLLAWCQMKESLTRQLQASDNTQDLPGLITQSAFYQDLAPFFQIKFLHALKENNPSLCR